MLAPIIEEKDEIAALCREYKVRALWVFGSAISDQWSKESDDIDALVEFDAYDETVVHRYLSLAERLESVFGCDVVLISHGGLRFRHVMRKHIDETGILLYG